MGRPINKKYFGTPTAGGNEIKVQFYDGAASKNGWIIKQIGSKKFRVTDGATTKDCTLVDKASAALAAGEMTITVKDDTGTARQVTKISGRKATIDTGASLGWVFGDANNDGYVEMEEAGDDAVIDATGTDEDDFESDDPA
jgi:hypothetical protein